MEHVELRVDHNITTADDALATPEDAHALHEWPQQAPEPGDDPVTVAVMDSGIHQDAVENHPWFDGVEVVARYDATGTGTGGDNVGHGTGCASIIAHNGLNVELIDVRIFGDSGRTGFETIRDAYEWMIERGDRIDLANLSWGAQRNIPQINQLHEKMLNAGIHDVVAAGNTGDRGGSPSTSRRAFSAGAVDASGDLTRFTSSNPDRDNPDVAAVGKNVKMARAPGTSMGNPINDQYTKASGTSFSAPYTLAGYTLAYNIAPDSWDSRFEKAAPDIPGSEKDGDGLFKLAPALGEGPGPEPNPTTDVDLWNFIGNDVAYIHADWLPESGSKVERREETKDHIDLRFHR